MMKIAIIGVARSRTTALTTKIHIKHQNLKCLYEYYTYYLKQGYSLGHISNMLSNMNNYIVKILSHNIFGYENDIRLLTLKNYDQIILIERPDFFNQCCSLHISAETGVWHNLGNKKDNYESIRKQKFFLDKKTVLYQARGVSAYLSIKKYLINNAIPFSIHEYEDNLVSGRIITNPNLDYSKLMTNYDLKASVEDLFSKCFNYATNTDRYSEFVEGLEKIEWC